MKRRILFVALAALLVAVLPLAGCSLASTAVYASEGRLADTKTVTSLDKTLSAGTLDFSLALYNRIHKDADGFFLSPSSIFLALAMTRNGANGTTASEMDQVLGLSGATLDRIDAYARDLQYLITGRTPSAFELANSLWIRDTLRS